MLEVKTPEEVLALIHKEFSLIDRSETVPLSGALGRVLAEDIRAEEYVPDFDRSTVDGYACRAADTFGCSDAIPAILNVVGEVLMGKSADFSLPRDACAYVPTGGAIPKGCDCAVMLEYAEDYGDGTVGILRPGAPGLNLIFRGDDVFPGKTVLKAGRVLAPQDIGALAAVGRTELPVRPRLRVGVISTGDEIVTGTPKEGQMRDVNSFLLAAALEDAGCEVRTYGAVKDQKDAITAALKDCLQTADAVLISGGSSAGTRDMTVQILGELGEVFFHGIAMKPGKPTIFGMAQGKPVFGLPGHPLAAYFVCRLIVLDALRTLLCLPPEEAAGAAPLAVNVPSNHGREEYLCVKRQPDGSLRPLHTKSGVISVLTQADGFIRVPRDAEGFAAGTKVAYYKV